MTDYTQMPDATPSAVQWVRDMTLNFDPARICEYPLVTPAPQ